MAKIVKLGLLTSVFKSLLRHPNENVLVFQVRWGGISATSMDYHWASDWAEISCIKMSSPLILQVTTACQTKELKPLVLKGRHWICCKPSMGKTAWYCTVHLAENHCTKVVRPALSLWPFRFFVHYTQGWLPWSWCWMSASVPQEQGWNEPFPY